MVLNQVEREENEVRQPCIWMQAGVVPRKSCVMNFDCPSCRYDRILRSAADENRRMREKGRAVKGKRGRLISWKETLLTRAQSKRPCIHHMKMRIEFRACTHEYRCGNCDFDQYFDDQYTAHALVSQIDVLKIEGFRVPQGYYFHPGHTWIKIEDGSTVRVGLDDFALRLLGPFDHIETPLMGKEVKQGRADIGVCREGHQAGIQSPVSGVVSTFNMKLREEGSLANRNPYSEGWVMRVRADNLRRDLKNLMIYNETEAFIHKEVERLYKTIEEVSGPLAADGGDLAHDIFGKMPRLGWERLVKRFLRTSS